MSFWIIAAAMAAGTVAVLALPLLRSRADQANPAAYDLEVYRDQIAELERDAERGVLTRDEMEAARNEIARRILAADVRLKAQGTQAQEGGGEALGTLFRGLAAVLVIAVPLGAVLMYLQLGDPGAQDMPFAARTDLPDPGEVAERGQLIAALEQAASDDPENPQNWFNLGLAYKQVQRYEESADALRKVLGMRPATPLLNSEYGEALFMAADGTVTPEARAAFEAVLAVLPNDPRAMHYLALGDYEAGRAQAALDRWAALIEASPADAPWLDVIREHLARAAEDLGLDLAEVMPEPGQPAGADASGLTPEQRAAVEAMTPEERQAMIREMVDGLEARLAENPTDLEGWERLIRTRSSMGEQEAAQEALDRALAVFAEAPFPKQRLAALAGELSLNAPETGGDAPDIGAMVTRLAARLAEDPDDLEGWLMLARSYAVLGENGKARDAMASAVRLAPDDPAVVGLQATTIRDANGGRHNAESIAVLRRLLELDPNNHEALWFVGNAEAEAGNREKAIELLERVYGQLPETSADRTLVRKRIDEIRGG